MLAADAAGAQAATVHSRESWFGADKVKHLLVSAFVQSVTYGAVRATGVDRDGALATAWVASSAVGVAKELRDRRPDGSGFSVRDLAWDAAGAGVATLAISQTRTGRPTDASLRAALPSLRTVPRVTVPNR